VTVDITTAAPAPFRTATYGPVVTVDSSALPTPSTPKKQPVANDDGPDPDGGLSEYV
jgi:hypothetical protein